MRAIWVVLEALVVSELGVSIRTMIGWTCDETLESSERAASECVRMRIRDARKLPMTAAAAAAAYPTCCLPVMWPLVCRLGTSSLLCTEPFSFAYTHSLVGADFAC